MRLPERRRREAAGGRRRFRGGASWERELKGQGSRWCLFSDGWATEHLGMGDRTSDSLTTRGTGVGIRQLVGMIYVQAMFICTVFGGGQLVPLSGALGLL